MDDHEYITAFAHLGVSEERAVWRLEASVARHVTLLGDVFTDRAVTALLTVLRRGQLTHLTLNVNSTPSVWQPLAAAVRSSAFSLTMLVLETSFCKPNPLSGPCSAGAAVISAMADNTTIQGLTLSMNDFSTAVDDLPAALARRVAPIHLELRSMTYNTIKHHGTVASFAKHPLTSWKCLRSLCVTGWAMPPPWLQLPAADLRAMRLAGLEVGWPQEAFATIVGNLAASASYLTISNGPVPTTDLTVLLQSATELSGLCVWQIDPPLQVCDESAIVHCISTHKALRRIHGGWWSPLLPNALPIAHQLALGNPRLLHVSHAPSDRATALQLVANQVRVCRVCTLCVAKHTDLLDLRRVATVVFAQKRMLLHEDAWQRAAIAIGFLRANRGHALRYSVIALLPTLRAMASDLYRRTDAPRVDGELSFSTTMNTIKTATFNVDRFLDTRVCQSEIARLPYSSSTLASTSQSSVTPRSTLEPQSIAPPTEPVAAAMRRMRRKRKIGDAP